MTDDVDDLHRRMETAAAALDFDLARRLRDELSLIRGGASAQDAAVANTDGLVRQQPGKMGLGSSRQRVTPPADWTPPPKPDLMTAGKSTRKRR